MRPRTNFKGQDYYYNLETARENVEDVPMRLGLCYKLVDIDWCAQVHSDPYPFFSFLSATG